jgi:hypothetical protein
MWATAGRLGLPVSIHSGDPKAFWQPIDENNERYEELREHPDWAFGGGAYPPREEILRQLEAVVARHPKVTFVGVHFGNDPEDVDYVAALLRRYANYNVDLGARIPEIGRQDPAKLRAMFIEFQDRILFGTDFMVFPKGYILGAGPVLTDEAEVTRSSTPTGASSRPTPARCNTRRPSRAAGPSTPSACPPRCSRRSTARTPSGSS